MERGKLLMEPVKWQELIRGILSLIVVTLSATTFPLYAVNDKPLDALFYIAIGFIVSILGAYGIDIVINRSK